MDAAWGECRRSSPAQVGHAATCAAAADAASAAGMAGAQALGAAGLADLAAAHLLSRAEVRSHLTPHTHPRRPRKAPQSRACAVPQCGTLQHAGKNK